MPSSFTHYLCGKKSLDRMKNAVDCTGVKRNVFNLGTQGPDIFFFHKQISFMRNSDVSKIGRLIHNKKINKFFNSAINYIKSNVERKKTLIPYFMGLCNHYALDSTAHPFIFYFSGFDKNGSLKEAKYSNYHREFETTIDYLISKSEENKTPYELNSKIIFKISKEDKILISQMLKHVVNETFNLELSMNDIVKSIDDFYSINHILRDRFGIKKFLFSKIEEIFKIKRKPSTMIHPIRLNDEIDYLNLKKNKWCLPWNNKIYSYQSFIELYDLAVDKTVKYFELINKTFDRDDKSNELLNLLGDCSYSTGKPYTENIKFRFHKSVYEINKDT